MFWENDLIGDGSLKQLFPDIFLLNQQQKSTLQKYGLLKGET